MQNKLRLLLIIILGFAVFIASDLSEASRISITESSPLHQHTDSLEPLEAAASAGEISPVKTYLDDHDGTNNTGTSMFQFSSDVWISKVAPPGPVQKGDNVAYVITLTNDNDTDALGVTLYDDLPSQTTFVSLTEPSGWDCTTPAVGQGGMVECSKLIMSDPEETFILTIKVSPTYSGANPLVNTAIIVVGNDSSTSDNEDSASIDVAASLVVSATCNQENLVVSITSGDAPFDITASAGINTPVLGVGLGDTIINGPEKWDDLTITETVGDIREGFNLGQFKCRSDERPVPVSPAHRTRTTNTSPQFSWTAVAFANNYRLFVFDDKVAANRTVDIRENTGGATQHTLSQPLPLGRLFWRARARTNRVWSYWSIRFTLFIDPPPAAPVDLTGSNSALQLPPPPNSR